MTANVKYPVQDCENLKLPIQIQLSEKRKRNFLFHFWNLHQILNILKEKVFVMSSFIMFFCHSQGS